MVRVAYTVLWETFKGEKFRELGKSAHIPICIVGAQPLLE